MMEKFDIEILNKYFDDGGLVKQTHPSYPLIIWNYGKTVQYRKLWDEILIQCRGLVTDVNGNILARPLKKFFNIEEHDADEMKKHTNQQYEIFEKLDGSLIILFFYEEKNEWIIASRGSFSSDQAKMANELMKKYDLSLLDKEYTYLFEIIYPENIIVVSYGDFRDLVLLCAINTKEGFEIKYDDLYEKYSNHFNIVKKYNHKIENIVDLKKLEENNKEGFVIRFNDGFRVKVKFAEYVRLHGILTNLSNIKIWENLKNNIDFSLVLEKVPDEFYNWVMEIINQLENEFTSIEIIALGEFYDIYVNQEKTNRKEFAELAIKSEHNSILFRMYDNKSFEDIIWKKIKPTYCKPYSNII